MDITTIIGFAAAALLLFRKQSDSVDKLQKQLEQLKQDQQADIDDITNKINENNTGNDTYIKKYIKVTPSLQFTRVANKNWIGRFTWDIKNTSSNNTFTITAVQAVFTLCGYTCQLFIPGNDDQIITLTPGNTAKLNSTWQDKRWFDDSKARDVIRESLRKDIGKSVGGKLTATITIRCISQVRGTKSIDAVYENIPGEVWLTRGAVHYYYNQGENFLGNEL